MIWTTRPSSCSTVNCGYSPARRNTPPGPAPSRYCPAAFATCPVANSVFAYPTYVRRRTVYVDASKQPDPWWKPMDENFAPFAQALIARGLGAGLGNLLKLGGLVSKRSKAIRAAVQKGA